MVETGLNAKVKIQPGYEYIQELGIESRILREENALVDCYSIGIEDQPTDSSNCNCEPTDEQEEDKKQSKHREDPSTRLRLV